MTIASGPDLSPYVERLHDKPVAAALIESLKGIASVAKPHQLTYAVGSSWATLALGRDLTYRGSGTLLTKAGAKGACPGEKGGASGEGADGGSGGDASAAQDAAAAEGLGGDGEDQGGERNLGSGGDRGARGGSGAENGRHWPPRGCARLSRCCRACRRKTGASR